MGWVQNKLSVASCQLSVRKNARNVTAFHWQLVTGNWQLFRRRRVRWPICSIADGFDLCAGKRPFALVDTMTSPASVFPHLRRTQILRPEWPGATLQRAHRINGTILAIGSDCGIIAEALFRRLQEDAIVKTFRRSSFLKREAAFHRAAISFDGLLASELQKLGK